MTIGTIAPSAVVVIASPTSTGVPTRPTAYSTPPAARPITSDSPQPRAANRSGRPAHAVELDLHPGQEEQEGEAQLLEHVEHVARLGDVEHVRPDDDPEHELGHDDRYAHPRRQVRDDRRERRDGEHDQQRLAVDLHRGASSRM